MKSSVLVVPDMMLPNRDTERAESVALRDRVTDIAERMTTEVAGFLDVLKDQADEAAAVEEAITLHQKKHKK